jgi:hypothetical protein
MTSPHLEKEKAAIQSHIEAIRQSGPVAPAGVQIVPNFLQRQHWSLANTDLPLRERDLGLHGSAKYHKWEEQIHRRDQITALEAQLSMVQRVIDLQAEAESLFAATPTAIDVGDLVDYEGKQYSVEDVGFRYLRLVDTDGHICRCEITQARLLQKVSYTLSPAGDVCYLEV